MSRTSRDRLRIRWILLATTDDDEARNLPRWGPRFWRSSAGRFVPCQVREDFMDHRSTWTTTVKSIAPQSSFLSQRRLTTTYTVRDCRQQVPLRRIGGGGPIILTKACPKSQTSNGGSGVLSLQNLHMKASCLTVR